MSMSLVNYEKDQGNLLQYVTHLVCGAGHHKDWNLSTCPLPYCQFHQHFICVFFVRKCFSQLFSSYVLALAKGFWQKKHNRTKNTHIKCWWNWLLHTNTSKVKSWKLTLKVNRFKVSHCLTETVHFVVALVFYDLDNPYLVKLGYGG